MARGRPRKKKIEPELAEKQMVQDSVVENPPNEEEKATESAERSTPEDPRLPNKSLFRIDEVANYFSVTERTVRLWIDHGHLEQEKIVGTIRVTRESILRCRYRFKGISDEGRIGNV